MKHFYVLAILLSLTVVMADAPKRSCGIEEHLHYLSQTNPGIYEQIEFVEQTIRQRQQFRAQFLTTMEREVRVIPVVVHVLYKTDEQNIPDEQIFSQIRILNEDFRRKPGTKGHNKSLLGADTMIEFRLAQIDPDGNPTNGITRTKTKKSVFKANDSMKSSRKGGQDPWDTTRYLNLWVCSLGGSLLGYAQFPGGPVDADGVVCLYSAFGDTGAATAPFNLGRTTTHEVGHWLGLRHIWGDGGCMVDDGCEDTPRSDSPNFGNPQHPLIKCGTDNMFENYMDYTDDAAMNIFTKDQSQKMNATLDTSRSGLLDWHQFSEQE